VSQITGAQLLDGIRDRDDDAPAGVDYHTLAEDYDVDDALVAPALACLRVAPFGDLPVEVAVHYQPDHDARPVAVHCYHSETRVREELEETREIRSPPAEVESTLTHCVEVVAIELGASQFETMGVVLSYEVARYLAQKGTGVFCDDENQWYAVDDHGALIDL
jgi:hypothetical protein